MYAGYELPTVRQIDVVATGVDCSSRDRVVLTLERPGCMNHRTNPQLFQYFLKL